MVHLGKHGTVQQGDLLLLLAQEFEAKSQQTGKWAANLPYVTRIYLYGQIGISPSPKRARACACVLFQVQIHLEA